MNEESHNPSIETELEARIVALVLGEASDFEREELNRLIELRPELAAFRSHMLEVHGLLQDVGTGEFAAPEADWKLPTDRRNAVLAVIRGETQEAETPRRAGDVNPLIDHAETVMDDLSNAEIRGLTSPARLISRWNLTKLAAVVCVAGFIGIMTIWSFVSEERASSDYFYSMAKSDAPRDEFAAFELSGGTSLSFARAPENVSPNVVELFARPASGEVDPQANSAVALSAIQDTLGSNATLPSGDYLADDVQYLPEEAAIRLQEAVAAEPAVSSSPEAETPSLIAKNETAWMARDLDRADQNGNGVADSALTLPSVDDRNWSFSADVDGRADKSTTAPAPSVRSKSNVADGEGVWLDETRSLAAHDNAPAAEAVGRKEVGELERSIVMEDKEQPASGMSRESRMGDLASAASGLEQPLREQQVGQSDVGRSEFLKEQLASPDGGEKPVEYYAGHHFSLDGFDVLSPKDANGNVSISPGGSPAGGGLGDPANRNAGYGESGNAGYGGFGGGRGGRGVNQPSDKSGVEMPTDPKSVADGETDGIANFGDSVVEESARSKAPGGSEESGDNKMNSVPILNKIPYISRMDKNPGGPTSQRLDLTDEAAKSGKSDTAGRETEEFEQKAKADDMPIPGGVALDGRIGVDFDSNVQDAIGKPTDTPAFGSPRLTFPGKTEGRGGEIQDGRGSERGRTPAQVSGPVAGKPIAQTEQNLSVNGGIDTARSLESLDAEPSDVVVREGEAPAEPTARPETHGSAGASPSQFGNQRTLHPTDVKGQPHVFFRQGGTSSPALDKSSQLSKKQAAPTVAPSAGLNETTAASEAFSTFSLHVSDVSFKLAAAALARGEWPEAARIRVEEFVNAFDYGDPLPAKGEKVTCRVEQSIHPFVQQRNLLRISMRTAAAGRATNTPLRLTFLLDNSGSMERTDRQQTIRRAFALLAQQLTPIDQVTLISFARQPRLLADKVSGADAGQLVRLIDELPSEGGTNIEAALQLAFEKAREQQSSDGQNRVILLTDGAVNLGDADPESLSQMVTSMRTTDIAFDAAGISADGLNDEVLEALTRKGDGRYYLLDSLEDADDGFVRQIAGALRPSAKNVKVQIEFNPKRVGHYKLLGFEKHILKKEDFRNDAVDAAEMAAAEAGVAMYQFEAKPDGEGDVGSVSVRFQDLSTGEMIENRWPIPYEADAPRPDQASPSLRIATSAALLAARLRGEPLGETVDLKTLSQMISGLPDQDRADTRVQQLQQMIEQARQLSNK